MQEIWREHKSGLLVSNLGQVFVPKNYSQPEHYTYGSTCRGYFIIYYNKIPHYVHDLVYRIFNPDTAEDLVIHHINKNRKDNRLENLIALSEEDHNKLHAMEKSKIILQYDLDGNLVKEWSSTREIERKLGYSSGNITSCCKGKLKTAYGYIWKYKE